MKAFAIIQIRAMVVPEYLFVEIPEQMKRLDVDVCSFQSALEHAPEILQTVCMHLPIHIAFRIVNRLVNEILIQSLIVHERIGVDRALRVNVGADPRLQFMFAARWHDARTNLSTTFQDSKNACFILQPAFRYFYLAFVGLHETG